MAGAFPLVCRMCPLGALAIDCCRYQLLIVSSADCVLQLRQVDVGKFSSADSATKFAQRAVGRWRSLCKESLDSYFPSLIAVAPRESQQSWSRRPPL